MESIISALNTMAVWEHERVEENISDEHVLPHAKAQFKRRNFPAPNLILIDVWINNLIWVDPWIKVEMSTWELRLWSDLVSNVELCWA